MKPFLPLVLVSSLLLAACGEKPAETPRINHGKPSDPVYVKDGVIYF